MSTTLFHALGETTNLGPANRILHRRWERRSAFAQADLLTNLNPPASGPAPCIAVKFGDILGFHLAGFGDFCTGVVIIHSIGVATTIGVGFGRKVRQRSLKAADILVGFQGVAQVGLVEAFQFGLRGAAPLG